MIIKNTTSQVKEDGTTVDQYELANTPYERARLARYAPDDDRLRVEMYLAGSDDPDTYTFRPVEYNFHGMLHDRPRRLVPDDVQNVLYRSGHVAVPHLAFFEESDRR